jgi:hypothetical protein
VRFGIRGLAFASLTLSYFACTSPARPSISVASARPLSPANGAQLSFYSQPILFVIAGGATSDPTAPASATIEVATDAAFGSIIASQPALSDGAGRLTASFGHLAASTTYYWRARTTVESASVLSTPLTFGVGPLEVIQAPVPVQPVANSFPHRRPTFTVTNVTHSRPDAALTYRFDVATDATFSAVVVTGTVSEGNGQTSFTPSADLISGTSYFWSAQASDLGKGVTGAYSAAQAFTTVFPDDGVFRYTVSIRAPAYCTAHSSHSGTSVGQGWNLSDYAFDGVLIVTNDTLQFTPDATGIGAPSALLRLTRVQNQLAGSILGSVSYSPFVSGGVFFNGVLFNASVEGDSDNAGHFRGTFDGNVSLDREGFPSFSIDTCSTSGFAWTLTPR